VTDITKEGANRRAEREKKSEKPVTAVTHESWPGTDPMKAGRGAGEKTKHGFGF
jgi:hypothetical protein